MMTHVFWSIICSTLLSAGLTVARDLRPTPFEPVMTAESYGVIRFGMKLSDAERLLGETAGVVDSSEADCKIVRFKKYPAVIFMVEDEDGVVTRAEGANARVAANPYGILKGQSVGEIKSHFP